MGCSSPGGGVWASLQPGEKVCLSFKSTDPSSQQPAYLNIAQGLYQFFYCITLTHMRLYTHIENIIVLVAFSFFFPFSLYIFYDVSVCFCFRQLVFSSRYTLDSKSFFKVLIGVSFENFSESLFIKAYVCLRNSINDCQPLMGKT